MRGGIDNARAGHRRPALRSSRRGARYVGVTMIGGEYASGMIRATLAAVPERGLLLAAKSLVLTAVTLTAGLVTAFSTFFVGLARRSNASTWSTTAVLSMSVIWSSANVLIRG